MERVLESCPLIAQAFVYGDSLRDNVVAVVVPDEVEVAEWSKSYGMAGKEYREICQSE